MEDERVKTEVADEGGRGGGWIGRLGERERRWKNENVSILRCIKQE